MSDERLTDEQGLFESETLNCAMLRLIALEKELMADRLRIAALEAENARIVAVLDMAYRNRSGARD